MGKYINYLKNWKSSIKLLKWLARHTKEYIPALILLLMIQVLSSVTSVGLTLINKNVIDTATNHGDIEAGILLYIIVTIVSLLVGTFSGVVSTIINERFSFSIRKTIYGSILHTRMTGIGQYHSGDVLTRLTSDVTVVATGISEIVPSVISLAMTFIAAFFTLLYYDQGLAVFALITGPMVAVISIVTGRRIRRYQIKVQETESEYRANLQENLENLVVIKAFECQSKAQMEYDALREKRLYWVMRRQKIGALARLALTGSFQLAFIVVFAYSAIQLSKGAITFGVMSMFFSLVSQMQAPLLNLAQMLPKVVSILASANRLQALDALPAENTVFPVLASGPVGIEIRDVDFSYGKEPVLIKISTCIHAGEFVALMGASGSGKTTLIRLIMAFYSPQSGTIRLTDHQGDSHQITAGARRYISYVPQGNTLMSGTIAQNLRVGSQEVDENSMWEVLKVVAADTFVRKMPDQLHTVIGERGLGLSEGQAQRIAIARALIRKAPLLILDEATSALDEQTEHSVLKHLQNLLPRPTCLLITHRRSAVQYCDRAVTIENQTLIDSCNNSVICGNPSQ